MTTPLRLVNPQSASTWTEAQLKELALDNPRAAMDMAVRKFRDRLYYHALYIVKSADEAYDIVQDVFIRAMRERRFFDPEFRMKAWLFRVTSNLCFNRVRDKKRRGQLLDQQRRSEGVLAKQVDTVFAGQRSERMNAALEQLTEAHREILVLRYYDDLSYAEIAETLNIALGTVMSRLSRARCRLLEAVGQQKAELDP